MDDQTLNLDALLLILSEILDAQEDGTTQRASQLVAFMGLPKAPCQTGKCHVT